MGSENKKAAEDAYDAIMDPAKDAYLVDLVAAEVAYDAVMAPAREAYLVAVESAEAAYDAAVNDAVMRGV